ncbi:hydroxysqualene dehydroxylase HpnE [Frankia sp. Cas4]|uniref:hydroxysqualene dehydroxylase HpnE n=1 Tax=Frankia sp. Cas4 TaxID=3073927 RepID=UPI002AD48A2C|nr:hydroxysqualene dehydroxylase HpnE [Frankia sp. Cas4]
MSLPTTPLPGPGTPGQGGHRLVVIGGGLAGLSAALVAADAGAEVTVLEARPRLGGATSSFARDGRWVDTGQHVFMRCCTAYRAFLRRLGVEHLTTLQDRLDVPVLLAGSGTRARLRRTRIPWPAPLHLTPALLGYRAFPIGQRLRAALAAYRLGRLDPNRPEVDGASFGSWLAGQGQSPAAIEALWELLTVATLNAPADSASLGLAATVVRTGLLERADAGDIGWADVPLQRLHGDAAASELADLGADVRTGVKVRELTKTATGWRVVTDSGSIEADSVILAVPPPAAAALLPAGAVEGQERFVELGSAPIVNVHMVYDRKVLEGPFLAVVGSPVQWVFDRTASSRSIASSGITASSGAVASSAVAGPDAGSAQGSGPAGPSGTGTGTGTQYLAISLSAADEWIDRPASEIRGIFVEEMRRLLPAARGAEAIEVFVTRERTATFRQAPGTHALRPGPATALPGLALAGAWTDTGWPATMEGAVRSGLAAAKVALGGWRSGPPSPGPARRLLPVVDAPGGAPTRAGGCGSSSGNSCKTSQSSRMPETNVPDEGPSSSNPSGSSTPGTAGTPGAQPALTATPPLTPLPTPSERSTSTSTSTSTTTTPSAASPTGRFPA